MKHFIINRIRSIGYAIKGAYLLLRNEASIQVQACIAVLTTIAGFYFQISATEWAIQLLTIAAVMGTEGMNTALEETADFIHPEHHQKIGKIKDLAAGAVFIVAIAAMVIGGIIYFPKIF
ncbi:MAG TPA: diacylglycerol kinase family protein [Sphingobacteriaceae bacterium]|nr:diacylglycerol kinase family protein [Sphingobacteriaceae bacterium]